MRMIKTPGLLFWAALALCLPMLGGCVLSEIVKPGIGRPEKNPWETHLKAESALEEAQVWFKAGEVDRAMELCQRAVTHNPGMVRAWIGLARGLYAQKKYTAAAAALDAAASLSPSPGLLFCSQGLALLAAKEKKAALDVYEKIAGQDVDGPDCRMFRGDLLMGAGRVKEAAVDYVQAALMAPGNYEAWERTGKAALDLDNLDVAEKAFTNAIGLRPKDPTLYFGRARARHKAGKPDEARGDYEKAVDLDPKMAGAWYHLGRLKWEAKDTAGAAADYQKALEAAAPGSSVAAGFVWYPSTRPKPPSPGLLALFVPPGPPCVLYAPPVKPPPPQPAVYEVTGAAPVYGDPSEDSGKLGDLPEKVRVRGTRKAGWVRLAPGQWMRLKDLRLLEEKAPAEGAGEQWITLAETPVFSGPSRDLGRLGKLPKGARVRVHETRGAWVRLGAVKWIRSEVLVRVYGGR